MAAKATATLATLSAATTLTNIQYPCHHLWQETQSAGNGRSQAGASASEQSNCGALFQFNEVLILNLHSHALASVQQAASRWCKGSAAACCKPNAVVCWRTTGKQRTLAMRKRKLHWQTMLVACKAGCCTSTFHQHTNTLSVKSLLAAICMGLCACVCVCVVCTWVYAHLFCLPTDVCQRRSAVHQRKAGKKSNVCGKIVCEKDNDRTLQFTVVAHTAKDTVAPRVERQTPTQEHFKVSDFWLSFSVHNRKRWQC